MRAIVPSASTSTERNVSPRRPAISDGGSRFMWRWVSAFRSARYSSRVAGPAAERQQGQEVQGERAGNAKRQPSVVLFPFTFFDPKKGDRPGRFGRALPGECRGKGRLRSP